MESGWAKICSGDYYKGFDELCSVSPLAKEALISTAVQYLGQDMAKLLKYNKRLQRLESAQDLQGFSWEEVLHEANDLCPDLVTLIDYLLQQGKRMHGKHTTSQVKRPNVALGMVLSLLLHFQDPTNYRATQQVISLLLHLSGCKEQLTYLSLSHLGICLGPASTLDFVAKLKGNADVCDTFKNTDLGTLGNNSSQVKQGSLKQRRKERHNQEDLERQLREEEMDVEEEWKDQLRQAAEEIGLDENDVDSCESEESADSTEAGSDEISSSDVDGDGDDHREDFEFYEQWKRELKQAAEAMGVDKEDLVSGNSNNASTDEVGAKDDGDDDDDDVQILDDISDEEPPPDGDENDEMGVHPADADQSSQLTKNGTGDHETEQNPNVQGANGKCSNGKKEWNIATNFYSKKYIVSMVDESPSKNDRSLCAKINRIDLTPAEEEDEEDDVSQSCEDDGGDVSRMEVEDIGDDFGVGAGNGDSNSFCDSYLNKKRLSREPVSPPKRTKTNGDSMEDEEPR